MARKPLILVLEGTLNQEMMAGLATQEYEMQGVNSVAQLLRRAKQADLLVIDTQNPQMTIAVYRQLKEVAVPLLLIASKAKPGFGVSMLEKPVDAAILSHQIENLLECSPTGVVQVGNLAIDLRGHRVTIADQSIRLAPTEFRLLACLARRTGQAVAYAELLRDVWEYAPGTGDRKIVANCIGRIRRKLGESSTQPAYLVAVSGVGYRLRNQTQWERATQQK